MVYNVQKEGEGILMTNTMKLVTIVAIILGINASGPGTQNAPKDKKMITVRAQDIPETVQIIGRLGQPLGSLLTVRGKWIDIGPWKGDSLIFQVDLVNGKDPNPRIPFLGWQVTHIYPLSQDIKGKPSGSWDWRFDFNKFDFETGRPVEGIVPPPTPLKGENWEMIGVETGYFEDYTEDVWREMFPSGVLPQRPMGESGFVTRFEYIAVRKLK